MAINSFEKQCDKIPSKHSYNHSKGLPSSHMLKMSIATDDSVSSSDGKSSKTKKNANSKSPYLIGDSVQLLSRVTEKKLYAQHKKADFISSFPLAASIYRANSDEFKSPKKGNKKVKKSVLTLPNEATAEPQMCTVSDTNDSKYADRCNENRILKPNRRLAQNRKSRVRNKNYEFYDRDARYCSQMNISLDCSSTDMMHHFTGDGKRVNGKMVVRKEPDSGEQQFNAHDVWAVLRNINKFQFRPSPPMSEDSIQTAKKKKVRNKRKNNRKDTRVIETCRTEEFAYISSYDVDSKSPLSFSQSSSFDRITVIDKQDEFSEICKEFQKSVLKAQNVRPRKTRHPAAIRNQTRKSIRLNNTKAIASKEPYEHEKKIQRESVTSPINSYKYEAIMNNIDYPETLVSGDYNFNNTINIQKKPGNNCNKAIVSGFHRIDGQPKVSNGTLHSGSSKAAVDTSTNLHEDYDKLFKLPLKVSDHQVKGITKVILSKNPRILAPRLENEIENKRTRIVSTLPRAPLMPKLTNTEIKRQLTKMKFPIVILGKDQLSSTPFQVMNYEPTHLDGLDKHVWPFMQNWYNNCTFAIKKDNELECQKRVDEKFNDYNVSKVKQHGTERKNLRKQNDTILSKLVGGKDKTQNDEFTQNKKKNHKRPVPPIEIIKVKLQAPKKSKPMLQLKDKMLKLLYKNASSKDADEQCKVSSNGDSVSGCMTNIEIKPADVPKTVDVGIETHMPYDDVRHELITRLSKSPPLNTRLEIHKIPVVAKQPWAKAKWASEFIETVIKKIRSGVYYNQENKQYKIQNTDISVQTILTGNYLKVNCTEMKDEVVQKSSNESLPLSPYDENEFMEALPGFDEILPAMEIKTFNMKEIAVKQCTTNVMVQFDIAAPPEADELEGSNSIQKSTSFVPLTVTESHTKIFKCKTTIINAMLPAEICSLLPKIILSIMNTPEIPATTPAVPYQPNECHLYTISELSNSESQDLFKPASPCEVAHKTPELLPLLDGAFSIRKEKNNNIWPILKYDESGERNLLLKLSTCQLIPYSITLYKTPEQCGKGQIIERLQQIDNLNQSSCTALELYKKPKSYFAFEKCASPKCEEKHEIGMVNKTYKLNLNFIPYVFIFDDNKIELKMTKHNYGLEDEASIIISNVNVKSLYRGFQENLPKNGIKSNNLLAIENADPLKKTNKQFSQISNATSNLKVRKNKFVKLYKKCKSTSNISGEKNSITLLSKILTLDDFLQALGTGKILSSIFDGFGEKKILSSIVEMKNWVTEISQRQAMLVLLLTNKKDTPNLIRFRPILLQGIAVNRITRASELDMEIEVIETENFHRTSKFEGIPYMMQSVENYDILLEELYWIAKTTASDYQKPFNEASEKLLKSLLQKRKKLNPSYLRVMARYVGLGLLKPSTKN